VPYEVTNIDKTPPQEIQVEAPKKSEAGETPITLEATDSGSFAPLSFEVSARADNTYKGTVIVSKTGSLTQDQPKSVSLPLIVAGEYHVSVKVSDGAGNISQRDQAEPLIIYPDDPSITKTEVTIP